MMTDYKSGVLIDVYSCRPDEIRTIALALKTLRQLALGDFQYLQRLLNVVLAQELLGDEQAQSEIKDLISRLDCVLWEGRVPWTVFDPKRASVYATLAHGLERRLAQDLSAAERTGQHLLTDRLYNPFLLEVSHDHQDQE